MTRTRTTRGPPRNTVCRWPPSPPMQRETTPDPLHPHRTLRVHAAQAAIVAVLRQHLPRPAARRAPVALARWKVDGAPPQAAHGDDDLMSAPQDLAPDPPRPAAAIPTAAPSIALAPDERTAQPASWRGAARPGDGAPDALFRIF